MVSAVRQNTADTIGTFVSRQGNSMKIDLSGPDITQAEIDAVVEVLKTGRLSLGPKVEEFEQAVAEYVGVKHGIAISSGTAALHLLMRALGVGQGDEVISTPFSFIASTNCVMFDGGRPVLARQHLSVEWDGMRERTCF